MLKIFKTDVKWVELINSQQFKDFIGPLVIRIGQRFKVSILLFLSKMKRSNKHTFLIIYCLKSKMSIFLRWHFKRWHFVQVMVATCKDIGFRVVFILRKLSQLRKFYGNILVKYSKIFLYSLFSCLGKMSVFSRNFHKKQTLFMFLSITQYRTFEFTIKRSMDESDESLED